MSIEFHGIEYNDRTIFCADCDKPLEPGEQYFATDDGLAICRSCVDNIKTNDPELTLEGGWAIVPVLE